jgi:glyoxylase-like metal-dependent hydrolase (beta-lactamase superfamily II)
VNDADAPPGAQRSLAPGVHQLALTSRTLPPFRITWTTMVRSGGRGLLIDPGFEDPDDAERLLAWTRGLGVRSLDRLAITHAHPDHVAGLPHLLRHLGDATVHAHPAEAAALPAGARWTPLGDGRVLVVGDATVRALHTPGHAPGHLAFEVVPAAGPHDPPGPAGLIAGDLLVGGHAPWIGLPDGDVDAYLDSVERMRARRPAWLAPAHGDPPADPDGALAAAAEHRRARRAATLAALDRPRGLSELVERIYGPVAPEARPQLRSAVLANLASLLRSRRIAHVGEGEEGPYARMTGDGAERPTQA